MKKTLIQLDEHALNSADAGLSLAFQILSALADAETVSLDFAAVERMTPSFANAFTMTLLHQLSLDELRLSVHLLNRNHAVENAVSESVSRYNRGFRLSTQQKVETAI